MVYNLSTTAEYLMGARKMIASMSSKKGTHAATIKIRTRET
jgi:hypothetical protein